ncbi:MAG: hypothetical protein HZA52_00095 [Planctomycetes bacterium]|nr:hypothetical protein [Planctomycetota bacterium]
MSTSEMNVDELPPKQKTPTWVWVVGSGCLVLVVAGLIAVFFTLRYVQRANDPERQWPRLAEVLPHDARPEGWSITGVPSPGTDGELWLVRPPGTNDQITLSRYPKSEAAAVRKALFDPAELEADAPIVGPVGRFDPVAGKVLVQGRELETLRYYTTPDAPRKEDGLLGTIQTAAATSNLLVDLSTDPEGELIVLEIRRQGKREPIPDADLGLLLAPFRIGTKTP